MRLARYVREAEMIPRGYAVSYLLPWTRTAVCYPMGLHWLVSAARAAWVATGRARFTESWEDIARVERNRGFQEGYNAGLDQGARLCRARIEATKP
jgi:hypothetical protein